MDLVIRYFNETKKHVDVRYFNSSFFGHGTAIDLRREFDECIKESDPSKMYQISMDGPSMNRKFYEAVTKGRAGNELHQLINIGSCCLHVIHGVFKSGAETTNWNINKVLRSAFQILHDPPARQEDYESVTGSKKYPLFFCATRFVFCSHTENIMYRPIPCHAFVNIFGRTVPKESPILYSI